MAWASYSALFVDKNGDPQVQVPKSCIESAEYIIQCIAQNTILKYKYQEARTPEVIAEFGDREFSVTKDSNIQNKAEGTVDYKFTCLPGIGEGIILLNKTKQDKGYNMHLGAVVAADSKKALISHMMEDFDIKKVGLADLVTLEIDSPEDFRKSTFGPHGYRGYAMGRLKT